MEYFTEIATKFLTNLPFALREIRLVEGFARYTGAIGDEPGAPHKGIDYILKEGDAFFPFGVHAMHRGRAFRGESDTWGHYVILFERIGVEPLSTVYAHLDEIPQDFPILPTEKNGLPKHPGLLIEAGRRLGLAGTSGLTHGIPQLHIELHRKDVETGNLMKLDPYGIYGDTSQSDTYPQPGEPIVGRIHHWTTDNPPFAKS